MRISGTEPSSVILSKTKLFQKLESGVSDSDFESLFAAILNNANNVAERIRKMSIRFSVVIHTYNVFSH